MPGDTDTGIARPILRRQPTLSDELDRHGFVERSDFVPAPWLPSPHLQTLWTALVRKVPPVRVSGERIELADGDFVDLVWTARRPAPTLLVLHGLEGSIRSPYARAALQMAAAHGWRGALMYFRGCSGVHNRTHRSYHSGETGDLDTVVKTLIGREPELSLGIVGYSLGGNVLLKWLGEQSTAAPVKAAVAVSTPLLLGECAKRMARGFSRFYQWRLLRSLRDKLQDKYRNRPAPIDLSDIRRWNSFHRFDEQVTAKLHGFAGADDYYERASARPSLRGIAVPTLIIQSRDDPFMTPAVLPGADELSPSTRLLLSEAGGHVGFVSGRWPWKPHYWLEDKVGEYFRRYLV